MHFSLIFQIFSKLSLLLYHFTWISYCNRVGRNVVNHNRASSYTHIVTNWDSWKDGDATANPHVIPDDNRLRPFLTSIPFYRVCAMTSSIDADIRANKTVIANGDTGFIEMDVKLDCLATCFWVSHYGTHSTGFVGCAVCFLPMEIV